MRLPTNIYLFQSLFLLTTPTAAAIFARRLSEENQSHRLFNASDKCPCLAEDQLPESFFISHCTTTCDDLNSRCMTLDSNNGTGECVPMDYGLGRCEYWDNYSGFKRQECKKKRKLLFTISHETCMYEHLHFEYRRHLNVMICYIMAEFTRLCRIEELRRIFHSSCWFVRVHPPWLGQQLQHLHQYSIVY